MTTEAKVHTPRSTALVLSGGGARGAYEVGVLSYLFGDFTHARGAPPPIDVICGTSVGAINGCYLAAQMADPVSGIKRLRDLWSSLELERVLRFGVGQALALPRLLRGGGSATGLFDVRPMVQLITREISWRLLARSLRRGFLRALSVSTTEIATGRTSLFVDTAPDVALPTGLGARVVVRRATIGPQHALASAAIPLVFPPVQIGSMLYCDGGLRQNTPMAPALRMGADRVLVIGLSQELRGAAVSEAPTIVDGTPGALFLLGKVLNAFLLDHVQGDLEFLQHINQMIDDGVAAYGPGFAERVSEVARVRGEQGYRRIEPLAIRPSQDIGRMAGQHVRRGRFSTRFAQRLLSLLDLGLADESDLASYLLFDGSFARKLMDLGRADAEAMREKLMNFWS